MMITTARAFGEMVRAARQAQGLSLDQMVFATRLSKTFLVDLEKGKPTCELEKALTVAHSLGIRLGDLREGH